MEEIQRIGRNLPDIENLGDYCEDLPELPSALIDGILRCGHKMLISGASKAGKSYLLMELALCIANGVSWLGRACKRGRVLYVNLEIDKNSCICRFDDICKALEEKNNESICMEAVDLWNLRGFALPIDMLAPELIERIQCTRYDAIIIDPIYKIITGDENNASEMGRFCNYFDRICTETGAAIIYCHHHSKGAQGSKRAADRASGSGVFARDPDALLDMIQLAVPDDAINLANATAWRIEGTLREFAPIDPINIWYDWPLHYVDISNQLGDLPPIGSQNANLSKSGKRKNIDKQLALLDSTYTKCSKDGLPVAIKMLAGEMGVTDKTIRHYIDLSKRYWCQKGLVGRL